MKYVIVVLGVFLGVFFGAAVSAQELEPEVSIFFEAETYTPYFYHGRAEPSAGSPARAVAVLSNTKPEETYSYTWTVENTVIGGIRTPGGNAITIPMPFTEEKTVIVVVYNKEGKQVAREAAVLEATDSFLVFYEYNPLRGTAPLAVSDQHILVGEQSQFRAVPYFMDVDIFNLNPRFEWSIDGSRVNTPAPFPQILSIQRTGGRGGYADIDLSLYNTKEFIQSVSGGFTLEF